jgi:hypothetical protein
MKRNGLAVWALCAVLMGAVGCGGVQIKTPNHATDTVLGEGKISSVTVTSSDALESDKKTLLTKNDVPNKLQLALNNSLKAASHADPAGALKLTVNITEMRLPANPGIGGADHVAGTITVTDASGTVVKTYEANGTSAKGMFMNTGRADRFGKILSDFAQKIVDGI